MAEHVSHAFRPLKQRVASWQWRRPAALAGTAALVGSLVVVLTASPGALAQPAPPGGALIVNNGSYPTQGALPAACATAPYATIQDAVNAAVSGDVIYVCAGTYNENVTISTTNLVLDGAEFGVTAYTAPNTPRTGSPETVIDSAGGVTYSGTGLAGETVSGFTLNGYTGGGPGEIQAGLASIGSAWTFTDNIVDASNGGIGLNTSGLVSPAASTVADNEFVQSTPASENLPGGWEGQAVTIWGESGNNVTITHNDFANLSGPGAAINTTGSSCSDLSTGLQVTNNTFEDNGAGGTDENFLALFCTSGATISGNTATMTLASDPNVETPIYMGGSNSNATVSNNVLSGNGAPNASGINLNSNFYPGDTGVSIDHNTISGFYYGIHVTGSNYGGNNAAPSGYSVSHNTVSAAGQDGIHIDEGADGVTPDPTGTVSNNITGGSPNIDCFDSTTGAGTLGTANTWTADTGTTSSPAGLCSLGNTTTVSAAVAAPTVSLGSSDADAVTVTGNVASGSPTGTVTFYECGPTPTKTACTSLAHPVGGATPLIAGPNHTATASSAPFTPASTGYWCFGVHYSGDTNYLASADTSTGECFNVSSQVIITSANSATATINVPFTFTVTTSGSPTPALSKKRPLPKGLTFVDNGNGTATISGTPAKHAKSKTIIIVASNANGKSSQPFSLTVNP